MVRFFGLLFAIVALAAVDIGAASTVTTHSAAHGWLFYLGSGLAVVGAALGTGNLTLAEAAKRTDPNGRTADIVELLSQTNEVLDDMVFKEGNLPTGNRTTVRTALPTPQWRLVNQGITPSKSTTAQVDDQAAMLEAWSEVDLKVLDLNGNTAQTRLSEARAFYEAMNQEMVRVIFYGNGGLAPEQFTGFAPRYNLSTAPNGDNVIKAGGSGSDNTSIYLVAWGDETVAGVYPKGSKAGLQHNDYGEVTVEMVAGLPGSRMRAMQERWVWEGGLMIKDWRYVVRIANIDVSDLLAANVKTLINYMEQAIETIPSRLGTPVFYMNRTMRRMLRKEQRESVGSGGGLTFDNYEGKRVLMFGDVPIRTVDQLLNTEAVVS